MKKFLFLVMLLGLCIISVGCGGSSNSYNNASTKTVTVRVANNIINTNANNSSLRKALALGEVNLFFNGVEFPGQSKIEEDYLFTKIMYEADIQELLAGTSSSTILITKKNANSIKIILQSLTSLGNLVIKQNNSGKIAVSNDGKNQVVIKVNDEEYVDLEEITNVKIEKLNKLEARLTFSNIVNESRKLDFDSWEISAYSQYTSDKDNKCLGKWLSTEDYKNKKIQINYSESNGQKFYLISLTDEAIKELGSHNLDNTIVKIDYIRKKDTTLNKDLDVVDTGVLEEAIYRP